MDRQRSVERLLPLRPVEFHMLLTLAARARHGYGMLQDMEEHGETSPPDVGTLYRALCRMEDQGLITASRTKVAALNDERRKYFRVTALGLKVARAEAVRLEALIRAARVGGLLPEVAT